VGLIQRKHFKFGLDITIRGWRKRFSERISKLITSRNMKNVQLLGDNSFSDKVKVQLKMLGTRMKNWIMGQGNCTEVVTKECKSVNWDLQLM
jgi:hypothetical protein